LSSKAMYGRKVITTDATVITDANIISELDKAMNIHRLNRSEIIYLWDYYRGKQPVLERTKQVRPEICNRIVENRANEIVSFKVGYLCGEPIQYVGRSGDDTVTMSISRLNELMYSENKASQDKEIVEWQMICGTAFRMVLPDEPIDLDDAPFEMYTLDPRESFVVYANDIGNKPIFGVKYSTDELGIHTFSIYSKNHFWKVKDTKVIESKPHALGVVPIFEYPANNARLGSFEIVLPLLDSINSVASNRLDGMEQFIQAFIKFVNCDISTKDFSELKEMGAIKVKSIDGAQADVGIVSNELNQDQTQTMVDYMYQTVLTICGMPNRNGGTSTSDTGSAVLLRDGWSLAEARAKDSELMFKKSEQEMLKLVLRICRDMGSVNIRVKDVGMQFSRRNYENIQSKSQVLVSMLQQPKIHPLLAFKHCGIFVDAENAYTISKKYYDEQMEQAAQLAPTNPPANGNE